MNNIKFKRIEKQSFSIEEVADFGYSLIDDLKGEVTDVATGKLPQMKRMGAYDDNAILRCTTRSDIAEHIDIFAQDTEIVYDLGLETDIEKAYMRSFFYPGGEINYSIGEFKLYAANDRDTLFTDENEVAHECGKDKWFHGDRNNADWLYEVDGAFRYFGIRITCPNPTDDIARVGYIALYNTIHTDSLAYLPKTYPTSIFAGQAPEKLTDGVTFIDGQTVAVSGKQSFTFSTGNYGKINKLWVIGKGDLEITVDGLGKPTVKDENYGRTAYVFDTAAIVNGEITVNVEGEGIIDQIGAASPDRSACVDVNDVLCDDFYGIGSNVLPMSFMPEAIEKGYNEVYWALERERIIKAKSNVVRLWFQPDWLCTEYEQYKNGNYDFESQKMQSVYRYLDAFKAAGTEIEFNFGWKVASYAQAWFSLDIKNKQNSAPKELNLFARCCAATLKELVEKRGYDNIKYLTFYNEPDGGNLTERGDFNRGDGVDRLPYWNEMLHTVADELKKQNIDYVKFWGCECCDYVDIIVDWINYMNENGDGILSQYTIHKYELKHKYAKAYFDKIKKAAGSTPLLLSECGQNYGAKTFSWEMNEIQLFQDVVKAGLGGAFIWCLNGIDITDPCSFTMRNEIDFWDAPHYENAIENVRENYYRWAMLSHYIPNHAKSVNTQLLCGGEDNLRVAAFTHGDDCTVVLELNNESVEKRDISIKLNGISGKRFYRHTYRMPANRDGNAIMPPVDAEIFAEDAIVDTVDGGYQAIVYTTVAPVVQVALPKNEVFLAKGEKYTLSGKVIDGDGEVAFELAEAIGDSAVFAADGTVSFAQNAKDGDMFAVRCYCVNRPKAANVAIFKYKA